MEMQPEQSEIIPENPVRPPRIEVIEKNTGRNRLRDLQNIFDKEIFDPAIMSHEKRNNAFNKAYYAVTENAELEALVIRGMTEKKVLYFAAAMNYITEACLSLTDQEIETIVRKFKEKLRSKSHLYANVLSSGDLTDLQTGRWGDKNPHQTFNPVGIQAVTRFVRARKKLHELSPRTFSAFYFNNYLDAVHKIDLIESIDTEKGIVLNLIQIKSREYPEGEIQKNTQAHRDWVNQYMTSIGSYEKDFLSEPPDSPKRKEFLSKIDTIEDVFIDVLTGDTPVTRDLLYAQLGIGNFPKAEQIWILENYLPTIKEELDVLVANETVDKENADLLFSILNELEIQLEKAKQYKNNLKGIFEIHSLCTVNEKVESDTIVFRAKNHTDQKAMKVS